MSRIEWTEATWNPIVGCTKISPGCKNCYAEDTDYNFPADSFKKSEIIYSKIKIIELPTNGALKLNGVDCVINQEIDITDYINLQYIPVGGYNGKDYLKWQGWDGSVWTTTNRYILNVTAVNDAPVLTPYSPVLNTLCRYDTENTGETVASLLGGSVSDVDSSAVVS